MKKSLLVSCVLRFDDRSAVVADDYLSRANAALGGEGLSIRFPLGMTTDEAISLLTLAASWLGAGGLAAAQDGTPGAEVELVCPLAATTPDGASVLAAGGH